MSFGDDTLDPANKYEDAKPVIKHPLIGVLDHGFVRLVNSMGSDIDIVRSARVSYNADWRNSEKIVDNISSTNVEGKDEKLIAYLLRNKHTSPFESVVFTFEIKCPIFVARQWHRHRTWAYNEVSARYTELPEEFYVPSPDQITTQSKDNKQMRTEELLSEGLRESIRNSIEIQCIHAFDCYKWYLSCGVARELARMVLPLNTYTRFFGTVNLHNLLHFLRLRLHPHAQYEIRVYAEAIFNIIKEIVPVTCKHCERELFLGAQ